MSLTVSDKESITHIVAAVNKSTRSDKTFGEILMRGGVTICAAGILAIFSMMFGMKYDLQANIIETKYVKEAFKEYKIEADQFFAKPNFTKDDFTTQLQPITQQVRQNTEQLVQKNTWMSRIENIVYSNERDLQNVDEDITEIKQLLTKISKGMGK